MFGERIVAEVVADERGACIAGSTRSEWSGVSPGVCSSSVRGDRRSPSVARSVEEFGSSWIGAAPLPPGAGHVSGGGSHSRKLLAALRVPKNPASLRWVPPQELRKLPLRDDARRPAGTSERTPPVWSP